MADDNGALTQVWCIAYDGDTPYMDGIRPTVRMGEVSSLDAVLQALELVKERSRHAPKRNLHIETRFVTKYQVYSPGSTTEVES